MKAGNPATQAVADLTQLPEIEHELSRTNVRLRFRHRELEQRFQAEQRQGARFHNRVGIGLAIALFDSFFIPELHQVPEAVGLSACLRFAVLTPALLGFLLLDWRGLAGRWYAAMVSVLLIGPTLMTVIESIKVTSPLALSNYQAAPLLMLAVLTCQVSLRQALVIAVTSSALYICSALTVTFVPPIVVPSLILLDLGMGITVIIFAWRIDRKDRQVFLFSLQAEIGRDLLAAQNGRLARLTQVDALTGLGNRRCFDETLAAIWAGAAREPCQVTLIMFDIDCFKQFNDAAGHLAGDECLAMLAKAAAGCARGERDTLVRYGGEEFAAILPATSLDDGSALAERVRQSVLERAIPHPAAAAGSSVVTISLGVASVLAPMHSAAGLIEAADRCLYAAKRAGRNRVNDGRETPAPGGRQMQVAAVVP